MKTTSRVIFAAAFVFCVSHAWAQGDSKTEAGNAGSAEHGKQLFIVKAGCYQCHGTVGQGGTGPHLAPKPLAIATLSVIVRKGVRGMPSYSAKVLSDADLADIRAYLLTIPEPPAASSIALLNP